MSRIFVIVALAVGVGLAGACSGCPSLVSPKRILPRRIIVPIKPPRPRVRPAPCPICPRRIPWAGDKTAALAPTVAGRVSPDGVPLECDYPADRWQKNLAGTDGAGLCVFASAAYAMDWHGIEEGRDLLQWMTSRPGGGYPAKFDKVMSEYFGSKNRPVPKYVQMEGTDVAFVRKAVSQGRIVCATYDHSPTGRYEGQRISHMVCVLHCDGERVAVADNNYVGTDQIEWLPFAEWQRCFLGRGGKGWAIAFDAPPPPPPPHN